MAPFILGTRKSPLALRQTEIVRAHLKKSHANVDTKVESIVTEGDRTQHTDSFQVNQPGVFVKALEEALRQKRVDVAIHSLKDLPSSLPDDLRLAAVLPREDCRDVLCFEDEAVYDKFVSHLNGTKADFTEVTIGTSSPRRQAQARTHFQNATCVGIRGNIGTRLEKLKTGQFDAVILAAAGMKRLGIEPRFGIDLPLDLWLPAAGQGFIAIECRREDERALDFCQSVNSDADFISADIERTFMREAECGCMTPVAVMASVEKEMGTLNIEYFDNNGSSRFNVSETFPLGEKQAAIRVLSERFKKECRQRG